LANADAAVRDQARALAVTFGSKDAIVATRKIAGDDNARADERIAAIDSLLSIKDPELPKQLQSMLGDAGVRATALRGLAAYNDPNTPAAVLDHYASYSPAERKDALSTLAARADYAKQLVSAVDAGKVSSKDFSADVIRQLRTIGDEDLNKQVAKVWGILRDSPADKKARIEQVRRIVEARGKTPNLPHGRVLFAKTCMQCHTLYDAGGHVGPDLTGSNRTDLAYLLENVVDPNAIIPNDYRSTTIQTTDGRTIVGIVKKEDDKSLTVALPNEDLLVPKSEIKRRKLSELSMMPEGLIDQFSNEDIRDLIAYLRSPNQVPLPAGAETAGAGQQARAH
jgi:putative heme-binding domain-containing protein